MLRAPASGALIKILKIRFVPKKALSLKVRAGYEEPVDTG
jgi:hypothetical protein